MGKSKRAQKKVVETKSATQRHFYKNTIVLSILVFLTAIVVYAPTFSFGLTQFDDGNLLKKELLTKTVIDALTTDAFLEKNSHHFYRPLQTISYMADAAIAGGLDPTRFHTTNVLLHALTCAALLLLFTALGYSKYESLVISLIYAVHPLFVQAVAWIPGRGDLLLGLFGVLCFYSLICYQRKRNPFWLILHAITLALSLLAKETGVILPVIMALYFLFHKQERPGWREGVILAGIWIIFCSLYLFLRGMVMNGLPDQNTFGVTVFMKNLQTLPETAASFFIPFNIPVMPGYSVGRTITGSVVIIIMAVLFFRLPRIRHGRAVFGALWMLLLFVPGMMTRILDGMAYDYLNHRDYFPMIGLAIVGFEILKSLPETFHMKIRQSTILTVIVVVVFASVTIATSQSYSDPGRFFLQAIKDNRKSAQSYNNYGAFLLSKGHYRMALPYFDTCVALSPKYNHALLNRVEARVRLGDRSGAIADCSKLIEYNPEMPRNYFLRAMTFFQFGDTVSSIRDFQSTVKLDTENFVAWKNLGILLMSSDIEAARAALLRAREHNDSEAAFLLDSLEAAGAAGPRQVKLR